MVYRAVVVRGDVGVEERHLHGTQAGRGARAKAARVEAQQQIQLVLDGLHLMGGAGGVGPKGGAPLGKEVGLDGAGPELGGGAWEGVRLGGRRG